jgi:hypothetical protein
MEVKFLRDGTERVRPEKVNAALARLLPGMEPAKAGVLIQPHFGMPRLHPQEKLDAKQTASKPYAKHCHACVSAATYGTETRENIAHAVPRSFFERNKPSAEVANVSAFNG